jgi:hypothetical protein
VVGGSNPLAPTNIKKPASKDAGFLYETGRGEGGDKPPYYLNRGGRRPGSSHPDQKYQGLTAFCCKSFFFNSENRRKAGSFPET